MRFQQNFLQLLPELVNRLRSLRRVLDCIVSNAACHKQREQKGTDCKFHDNHMNQDTGWDLNCPLNSFRER